jgi:hypothetical protein
MAGCLEVSNIEAALAAFECAVSKVVLNDLVVSTVRYKPAVKRLA